MAYGDYTNGNGYWMNGIWYPFTGAIYPTTYYSTTYNTAPGWQCPGCKTYYAPTQWFCNCAKDAEVE